MESLKFKIPFRPPSVNTYWRRGARTTYLSNAGREFKKNVKSFMENENTKILEGPLKIKLELHFKHKTKRDIDNYCKGIFDSLTGILWTDDSQIEELRIQRFVGDCDDFIYIDVEEKEGINGVS